MKLFFAIMLFAICLFSMPGTSSGSGSPPDQVSFVAFQPSSDLPVMAANYEMTANLELTFVSNPTFEMAVLPREGGYFVVQDSNLELQTTYKNSKNATFNNTENTRLDNYYFRTCLTEKVQSQIIITHNIESGSRCTIRAESQV